MAAKGPLLVTVCVYTTLLPAATDVGTAVFVTIKSAWAAVATTSAAVALLFPVFGSAVVEVAVTVSLIAVPATAAAMTFSLTVKLALPTAKLGLLHVMVPAVPAVGVVQDHPATVLMDWNVVSVGVISVKFAAVAALGPALVMTWV